MKDKRETEIIQSENRLTPSFGFLHVSPVTTNTGTDKENELLCTVGHYSTRKINLSNL